ncbi:corticotropin releasing hormone receptor 2 [Phyllostomus discolor]|uniref:Corticotropin releasing hormone receptor 2 n=1 Tax=Phyllostomus discolor TaxID=89673 RepID=A0A834DLN8_9CHIR|nr:corticotropin releasing hormone receptor 2 [Phyllostomus discolor]
MDVALLHSLLEANCSLALAEELFSDGWAQPLDPEGPYSYCNTTVDQIGTCWPRSAAGALVERPCPEYFNGVKYNTTRNAYRECSGNGTWASRIDYSQCVPILDDKEHSLPSECHSLEPHHHFHPAERHLVPPAAHRPRSAREQ